MAFTSDCWNHADESSSSSFRNKTFFFYILLRPEDSTANERKGVWASSTSVARFLIVWWVLLYIFIILAGRICVLRFGSQGERFLPSERKQAHRNRTSSLSLSKGERRGNNNNIKKKERAWEMRVRLRREARQGWEKRWVRSPRICVDDESGTKLR